MNKAFVREGDPPAPRCPECDTPGQAVPAQTVAAMVSPEQAARLSSDACYCANPACPLGYFDTWGGRVPVEALAVRAFPKDPLGPVCGCLGVTAAEIAAEAGQGRKELILRIIARVRSPEAACGVSRPDGRPCEREVRRLFQQNAAES